MPLPFDLSHLPFSLFIYDWHRKVDKRSASVYQIYLGTTVTDSNHCLSFFITHSYITQVDLTSFQFPPIIPIILSRTVLVVLSCINMVRTN